jgi:hypothetical protein
VKGPGSQEMQDIGGLRIVSDMDLDGQDKIVRKIVDAFPVTRVIDRRINPSHGYRALHVIATVDERPILGAFLGCCASAITPRTSNSTAIRIDDTPVFFIAHLLMSLRLHSNVTDSSVARASKTVMVLRRLSLAPSRTCVLRREPSRSGSPRCYVCGQDFERR